MRLLARAALAAVIAFVCLGSASAAENHGSPPAVGTDWLPTPRLVCEIADALPAIFKDTDSLRTIAARVAAVKQAEVCGFGATFHNKVTVVDEVEVGTLTMTDQSQMKAWSIHGKFPDGEEVWLLWLELVPGKGV